MAVSRPLILAPLAAVLCAITFYAATGAQRTSAVSSAAAPPAAPSVEDLEPTERLDDAPARPRDGQRADGARENRADRPRRNVNPPLPPELRVEGLPRPVARALADKRTIVLYLRQGGADDALVGAAVDAVRGMRGVSVFSAPIQRLGRYSAVIGGLGLAQAPAVAIVGRNRQARVVEGFVDPATLRQLVLDVR